MSKKVTVPTTAPEVETDEQKLRKLFVYGIFLGEGMRNSYGLQKPYYSTVKGYATFGHNIVQAVEVDEEDKYDFSLTGLLCEVAPLMSDGKNGMVDPFERLDALEAGYDRVIVQTTSNESAWMYVAKRKG